MTFEQTDELTYFTLPEAERRAFHNSLFPVFEADEKKQGLTIPDYNYRAISIAAKTADGEIAGGLKADTAWNELHICAIAVNPDCRVPGTGTALMKHAEELARTQLHCDRILLEVFDWEPKGFFERLGFSVVAEQPDHPHGHTKMFLTKAWPTDASSNSSVPGYDKAATTLTIEPWEEKACDQQLRQWLDADAATRTADGPFPVPKRDPYYFAIRVTHADGSLAAGVSCLVIWNELHVNLIAVVSDEQRRGIGSKVMTKLNEEARERHCEYIVLETSSWQGRPFYEKNGFTVFMVQQDVPPGFQRYKLMRPVPKA